MKNRILTLVCITLLGINTAHADCSSNETSGEEVIGTLFGAALGGLIGSQIGGGTGQKIAIGAGVLAGGMLGNNIASKMSCQDQEYHQEATQEALESQPTGQSAEWVNPDSGHSGTVTPTRTYTSEAGSPCREFSQTINVDGEAEVITATACRQDDGSWMMMDS